jgi:hypothetical protein
MRLFVYDFIYIFGCLLIDLNNNLIAIGLGSVTQSQGRSIIWIAMDIMLAAKRQSKGTIYTYICCQSQKENEPIFATFNLFGYKLMAEQSNPKPKKLVVLGLSCNLVC